MVLANKINDRILEEGDRMYLNALDNQVIPYSEIISLNLNYMYLATENVPVDVKFILKSNSSQTSIQDRKELKQQ